MLFSLKLGMYLRTTWCKAKAMQQHHQVGRPLLPHLRCRSRGSMMQHGLAPPCGIRLGTTSIAELVLVMQATAISDPEALTLLLESRPELLANLLNPGQ